MNPSAPLASAVLPLLVLAAYSSGAAGQGSPAGDRHGAAWTAERVAGGGGLELAVYEAGTPGRPAIVFIHGFSQTARTWQPQLESALADEFHLVAYDLRGHGGSGRPLDAGHYADGALWADDLAAVIRAKNLQRPVVVGWSYGGYVISDYVRRFGDGALGGIVIVGSTTKNGTEAALPFFGDEVLAIFGDLLSDAHHPRIAATRRLVDMFVEPGTEAWISAFGSAMTVPAEIRQALFGRVLENDDVLARITVPTLVVHGADDPIVRPTAAQHTAATVPGARLLLYEGARHAAHRDAADRFNRDLAGFTRAAAARRRD
jgi:non-heme chloroperoxidase